MTQESALHTKKMVTGEFIAIVVSTVAAATLIALRKSKCFVRRLRSELEYGIGFTDRPIVVNELSLQSKTKDND